MGRLVMLYLLFALNTLPTIAQKTNLKGGVVDADSGKPISFATVAVYRQLEIVDGVSANEEGDFELIIKQSFTHIEVSFIGYKTQRLTQSELEDNDHLLIELSLDMATLDEVIISGKKTTTEVKLDRKIINLGSDIQQTGVSALDAFDHIPEVQIDLTSGLVSLRGSGNVRVLINGKPSSLNSTEILQQILVSSIDRIELITSPSAKYRADGLAGIINIILKKQASPGLNVAMMGAGGTGGNNIGLSGNYNSSMTNLRWSISKQKNNSTDFQTIKRQFSNGHTEDVFTPYIFDGDVIKVVSGVDIFVQEKHELSFEIDYTADLHHYENKSSFTNVSERDDYTRLRENMHFHYVTIFNTNYRLSFDSEEHFVEFDYNLHKSNNRYPISDFEEGRFLSRQLLTEDFALQSVALDYTIPIGGNILLDTGLALNTQKLESENLMTLASTHTTNDQFEYDEEVGAIYGMLRFSISHLNIQAGLRYERFTAHSKRGDIGLTTSQDFLNVFPVLHVSLPFNDHELLKFGYSQRISRPNFHHVNALQVVSPLFIWEYNKDITPELSDNIELSYQNNSGKTSLGGTAFYRHRKNVILWTESTNNNQPVFRYENSGTFNTYGLETRLGYEPAPFWFARLSSQFYFTKINKYSGVTWDKTYSSNIQVKNTFDIGKKITLDLTYNYVPKRQNSFNYIESRNRLDLALSARFLNDKLSFNLRMVDLFDNNTFNKTSVTENLTQSTIWEIQSQSLGFLFSMNYKLFEASISYRKRKDRVYNDNPID